MGELPACPVYNISKGPWLKSTVVYVRGAQDEDAHRRGKWEIGRSRIPRSTWCAGLGRRGKTYVSGRPDTATLVTAKPPAKFRNRSLGGAGGGGPEGFRMGCREVPRGTERSKLGRGKKDALRWGGGGHKFFPSLKGGSTDRPNFNSPGLLLPL